MKINVVCSRSAGGRTPLRRSRHRKLDYPETVRAGEPFALSVTVSGTGDAPASCSFNGETRLIPPNLHHYAAGKLAAKYSKIEADGAVTAGSDYHTLLSFPLPQDGKSYTVWVRASGGALCLQPPGEGAEVEFRQERHIPLDQFRELEPCAGRSDACADVRKNAVCAGGADSSDYRSGGGVQACRGRLRAEPVRLGAGRFRRRQAPVRGDGFGGRGECEAHGRSHGSAAARETGTPVPAAAAASGGQRPLDLAKLSVRAADYPLFDFFGKECREALEKKPVRPFIRPRKHDRLALQCIPFAAGYS